MPSENTIKRGKQWLERIAPMSEERIKEKIEYLKATENNYMVETGKLDKQIKNIEGKKRKIAKSVSKIRKSRNYFVDLLIVTRQSQTLNTTTNG